MNRDWYKPMVALMWLVLPITAANYWSAWDQLPARIAVHFDANWQPNGYTTREGAVMLGLGIMAVMLVLFTVTALIAQGSEAKPFRGQCFWSHTSCWDFAGMATIRS